MRTDFIFIVGWALRTSLCRVGTAHQLLKTPERNFTQCRIYIWDLYHFYQVTLLRKPVVSDELKPMKSRHRDREITPTVYMELRREETEF